MIAPTPFFANRGTHIRILEEARALERRGHEVIIATYHIGDDIPDSFRSRIDVRRIRRLLFWYKKLEAGPDWQKIFLDIMLIRKTFFLARTLQPDVLHGHLHEGVVIGWIVKYCLFWRRMKLIADFHGSLTKEMVSHEYLRQGILNRLFLWIEWWIDRLGDGAVASSWENAEEIERIRGRKVEVLLDGTDIDFVSHPSCSQQEVRKHFGVPEDAFVPIYTGALIPNKGVQFLFDAIPIVLQKEPSMHFVIAGFPGEYAEKMLAEKSWSKSVTLISPLPYFDLPEVLRMGDVGIEPKEAHVRQASGKILNYMGAGLPVVCFDTKNNREYIGDGAFYAREISAEGLAGAILQSCWSREEASKKADANRERAKAFGWEKAGEKLEKIYRASCE